jgi:SecD/SecF fusion protein
MRNLYRHLIVILVVVLGIGSFIFPPETQLKRAKDLAGGSTLVYQVELRPTDSPDTINRVKDLISRRLDPQGILDIQLVTQGSNRIEISMPLPNNRVKDLRRDLEEALEQVGGSSLRDADLQRLLDLPAEQRATEFAKIAGSDSNRLTALQNAASTYDTLIAERAKVAPEKAALTKALADANAALEGAKAGNAPAETLTSLQNAVTAAEDKLFAVGDGAARAEVAFDQAQRAAITSTLTAGELRRVMELSKVGRQFALGGGKFSKMPSPREAALERLKTQHPQAVQTIERVMAKYDAYEAERKTLDDPSDVRRLLRSTGVMEFRITVEPGERPDIEELRKTLREGGPRAERSTEVRWSKLNKLDSWFQDAKDVENFKALGTAQWFARRGYVVDDFDGEQYMLMHDVTGRRLTQAEGAWSVSGAGITSDDLGKPAISFRMDATGAVRMGDLTGNNTGRKMAILLDDQVYTAPNIQSRIGGSGIITGTFDQSEIDYIVRVLGSGSMAARLSPEPISQSTVGPELGADNLQRGIYAGVLAFVFVAGFMIVYYFGSGLIAVFSLMLNAVLLLGLMAMNHAAFSLPGIAGVVLTFGMAVDANVLVYERIREEMERGADFRNGVRLGFARAMSSIIDGNLTVLIVSVVLAFTGTQEIKGFAITMIVGSLTTFFTQLYVTRILFYLFVDKFNWRKGSMLPIAWPWLAKALKPNIDWMKYRPLMLGFSLLLTLSCMGVVLMRGEKALDNDFVGGTKVTVQLKAGPDGKPMLMSRADAEKRVKDTVASLKDNRIADMVDAEILAINPDREDATKASRFTVKTTATETSAVQEAVLKAFVDVVDVQPPITFTGIGITDLRMTPIKPILTANLGDNIDLPANRTNVSEFIGGAAVVLRDLSPAPSVQQLEERLRLMRNDPGHAQAAARNHRWVVLEGDERAVKSAVLVVRDDAISFIQDADRWNGILRQQEWKLVTEALSRSTSLAGTESFSPSIAASFVADAIVAVVLSALLIAIYIWLRFQSFRYSVAAMASTLHDCVVATGLLAACFYFANTAFGQAVGLSPFKIDLNVVAAVLTILGYSLNDTVIVMDRIRETKGKAAFASRAIINDAINSTVSRTIITSGLVLVATLVLYVVGGEAIRPFAFTFLIGVITGTYSSVFIAAAIVYVKGKSE